MRGSPAYSASEPGGEERGEGDEEERRSGRVGDHQDTVPQSFAFGFLRILPELCTEIEQIVCRVKGKGRGTRVKAEAPG